MHKEKIKKRNAYMFVARLFIMAYNQGNVLELGGWLLNSELEFLLWHKVNFKKQKRGKIRSIFWFQLCGIIMKKWKQVCINDHNV